MQLTSRLVLAVLGATLSASLAQGGTAHLVLNSQPGDYVGQGQNWDITYDTGAIPAATVEPQFWNANLLTWYLKANTAEDTLSRVWFGTDQLGMPIQPGHYTNAQRAAYAQPGHPGLEISFQHRGCNTLTGEFTIYEVTFSPDQQSILAFSASFEQHCDGATPAPVRDVHVHAPRAGIWAPHGRRIPGRRQRGAKAVTLPRNAAPAKQLRDVNRCFSAGRQHRPLFHDPHVRHPQRPVAVTAQHARAAAKRPLECLSYVPAPHFRSLQAFNTHGGAEQPDCLLTPVRELSLQRRDARVRKPAARYSWATASHSRSLLSLWAA